MRQSSDRPDDLLAIPWTPAPSPQVSAQPANPLPDMLLQLAHELSTPLSTMSLNLEALRCTGCGLFDERVWDIMLAALNRQRRLLNSLLMVGQSERGDWQFDPQPVALDDLLHGLVQEYQLFAQRKGVDLSLNLGHGGKMLRGDAVMAQLVATNLLDNAIKYTPAGGKVGIHTRTAENGVCLDCTDTGPGMSEDETQALFQPYYRTQAAKNTANGSGIGLYLVSKLMEGMGGCVYVRSRPGQGSVFTAWFPAWDQE